VRRLNEHIVQASSLGLGGEYLVQDTVLRIQRLKTLVDVSAVGLLNCFVLTYNNH
jgi:hypothetical protein